MDLKYERIQPMTDVINFYHVSDEFGCFSNFAPYPVRIGEKLWPTSEHYFQAQKFEQAEHQEKIRQTKSPMIAARMGRDRKKPLRRDWESVKVAIMREVVRAKFNQHDGIRQILLSTGDAKIVEHTENDSYWGDGGDGSGKNMLGRILMEIREELRRAADDLLLEIGDPSTILGDHK
jgi:N-glycosidase YbiA